MRIVLTLLLMFIFYSSPSYTQVFLQADSLGDAYSLISSKGFGYEVPDCKHHVTHIFEKWDKDLQKYVFVFNIHRAKDDDRCINTDRQRNEIKTWTDSPDSMKGFYGETVFFRWKFFLDDGFRAGRNFCHIHQIKAGNGPDDGPPLLTITPRGSALQVCFIPPSDEGKEFILDEKPLAKFKGEWIEAIEKITYAADTGKYSLQLRRVNDDKLLLNCTNNNISTWRAGSTFNRPKFGIYRSLKNSSSLRDETVLFADFSLHKLPAAQLPAAPSNLSVSTIEEKAIVLKWKNNSFNEDQFRIDRSEDGSTWSYLATVNAGISTYQDTLSGKGTYYYRVRAENQVGNSVSIYNDSSKPDLKH